MKFPSMPRLALQQLRYQLLTTVRSPVGLFFTLILPVVMLVLFGALFGDATVDSPYGAFATPAYYTGGLAAFTAVSATYTNLVNVVPIRRDSGTLKRWRSTPIPTGVYLAGWLGSACVVAAVGAALQIAIGVLLYDVQLEAAKLPALLVAFVVGIVSWSALGLGVAALVPNEDSAPAVANATILPLAFISDTFIPMDVGRPGWLKIADWLPLKPFVNSFQETVNPLSEAPAFQWDKLAVVAAWGAFGAFLAVTKFRWEPATRRSSAKGEARHRRRRRGVEAVDAT